MTKIKKLLSVVEDVKPSSLKVGKYLINKSNILIPDNNSKIVWRHKIFNTLNQAKYNPFLHGIFFNKDSRGSEVLLHVEERHIDYDTEIDFKRFEEYITNFMSIATEYTTLTDILTSLDCEYTYDSTTNIFKVTDTGVNKLPPLFTVVIDGIKYYYEVRSDSSGVKNLVIIFFENIEELYTVRHGKDNIGIENMRLQSTSVGKLNSLNRVYQAKFSPSIPFIFKLEGVYYLSDNGSNIIKHGRNLLKICTLYDSITNEKIAVSRTIKSELLKSYQSEYLYYELSYFKRLLNQYNRNHDIAEVIQVSVERMSPKVYDTNRQDIDIVLNGNFDAGDYFYIPNGQHKIDYRKMIHLPVKKVRLLKSGLNEFKTSFKDVTVSIGTSQRITTSTSGYAVGVMSLETEFKNIIIEQPYTFVTKDSETPLHKDLNFSSNVEERFITLTNTGDLIRNISVRLYSVSDQYRVLYLGDTLQSECPGGEYTSIKIPNLSTNESVNIDIGVLMWNIPTSIDVKMDVLIDGYVKDTKLINYTVNAI